jgi:hypothetical protein
MMLGLTGIPKIRGDVPTHFANSNSLIANNIDWRNAGVVSPVNN